VSGQVLTSIAPGMSVGHSAGQIDDSPGCSGPDNVAVGIVNDCRHRHRSLSVLSVSRYGIFGVGVDIIEVDEVIWENKRAM
jgi:hypothetical protein